jgi:hypothetical protein
MTPSALVQADDQPATQETKFFWRKLMRSKPLIVVVLILLATITVQAIQGNTEWVTFTAPENSFSVLLPHEPTLEVVPDPDDAKVTHNRFNEFEKGYGFVIEYFSEIHATDADQYFAGFQKGFLETTKGVLLKESKISINGWPGRELEVGLSADNGTKVFCTLHVYIVGQNLYSLSFIRLQEMDRDVAAGISTKYFSSFKLIKK